MVTPLQRREIKKRMRRIKDARDNNEPEKIIKQRTTELYRYLESEGLTPSDV